MYKKVALGFLAAMMGVMICATPVHAENKNVIVINTSDSRVGTDVTVLPNGVVFDYGFYAITYTDVSEALGTSHEALLNHYLTFGVKEGRYPNVDAALAAKKYKR